MNDLKKTGDDIRIMGENSAEEFFTWVDAAYAVHYDIKSQKVGKM